MKKILPSLHDLLARIASFFFLRVISAPFKCFDILFSKKSFFVVLTGVFFISLSHAAGNNYKPVRTSPPPSANLEYKVTAQYSMLSLNGDAQIAWRHNAGHFSVQVVTNAAGLGKILESQSEGRINAYGLAPEKLLETRFRRKPHTVTFDHDKRVISFSESDTTYPLSGGEQDRTSVTWQIVSIARGAPSKTTSGREWSFFVAGRKNAEHWTFRVQGQEAIFSPLGNIQTVHITKLPSANRQGQTLDLWLAPALEWYPVKMVFTDEKGLTISQTLVRIHPQQPQANASQK